MCPLFSMYCTPSRKGNVLHLNQVIRLTRFHWKTYMCPLVTRISNPKTLNYLAPCQSIKNWLTVSQCLSEPGTCLLQNTNQTMQV